MINEGSASRSPSLRTAFLDHLRPPHAAPFSVGSCAVVVEENEADRLRADVADIVASAPRQDQYQPTFDLLYRLFDSRAVCVFTRPQASAIGTPQAAMRQFAHSRELTNALVADGVDLIVTSGPVAGTPWLPADIVTEPLLRLPDAIGWAFQVDLSKPERKPLLGRLVDRMRVIDVGETATGMPDQ